MRRLNHDPAFAAARDKAAPARIEANQERIQRFARFARRGVHIPPEREAEWRVLKRSKMTNREAAAAMGLIWLGNARALEETDCALRRATEIAEDALEAGSMEEALRAIIRVCRWSLKNGSENGP